MRIHWSQSHASPSGRTHSMSPITTSARTNHAIGTMRSFQCCRNSVTMFSPSLSESSGHAMAVSVADRPRRPMTRETPRKLAPPRGVPGPAVSAPRGRFRRYERPFDRSCLSIRPKPSGEVSFHSVPARGPLPMAPCGADSAPFGGCPVELSRPPFGLRADPLGPDASVPVSLPGDKREGRAVERVRLPKTLMRFREGRRRFARRR